MVLCPSCKEGLESIIGGWHARQLGPRQVIDAVRELGYGRADAARFLLQLVGDRFKVRVGWLQEAQL